MSFKGCFGPITLVLPPLSSIIHHLYSPVITSRARRLTKYIPSSSSGYVHYTSSSYTQVCLMTTVPQNLNLPSSAQLSFFIMALGSDSFWHHSLFKARTQSTRRHHGAARGRVSHGQNPMIVRPTQVMGLTRRYRSRTGPKSPTAFAKLPPHVSVLIFEGTQSSHDFENNTLPIGNHAIFIFYFF